MRPKSRLRSTIVVTGAAGAALLAADWLIRSVDRAESRRTFLIAGLVALLLTGVLFATVAFLDPLARIISAQTQRPIRLDQIPPAMIQFATHAFAAALAASAVYLVLILASRRRWDGGSSR